eukprot:403344057
MKNQENKPNGIFGSIYNLFAGSLRSIDRFGYPVSLTYKNNQTFTSGFGGCMTILSFISLIIYFGFMLNDVIQRNRYTITETTYLRDLYSDTSEYKFSRYQFDYAVFPVYAGFNPAVTNIHQYFSLKFYTIIQSPKVNYTANEYPINITYSDVNYTQCTPDRFNGEPARAGISLVGWLCPNFTDLTLQGKGSSLLNKKFRFEVTYCEKNYLKQMFPNLECKPTMETDAIIQDTYILISQLEQYLDVGEFDKSPLKNTIRSAQMTLSDDTRFDWLFLSENYVILKDSRVASTIGTQNITYSMFRNQMTNQQKRAGKSLFLQQSILIDDLVKITQRTTYNLIDALTATGGFASIIMIIFRLLTSRIQKILYFTSIIKKLYLHMDDKFKDQIYKIAMNNIQSSGSNRFQNPQGEIKKQNKLQQTVNKYIIPNKHGANSTQNNQEEPSSQRDLLNKKQFQNDFVISENQGVRKLQKEFDMVRHLKKIRVADSVAELTLSQFQRELIPFFDRNILNGHSNSGLRLNSKKSILNDDKELSTSLKQIVLDSRKSAIDQRIIGNLGVLQDTTLYFQTQSMKEKRSIIISEDDAFENPQKCEKIPNDKISPRKIHKKKSTKQKQSSKIKQIDRTEPVNSTKKKVEAKSKKISNEIEITEQNDSDRVQIINPNLKNNIINNCSSSPVTSDAQSESPKIKKDPN